MDGEEIEVLVLPFAEVVRMVAAGEIMDGKTILLVQYLQLKALESQGV